MKFAGLHLRQRDGISCGPSVAVVAAALLQPDYGRPLRQAGAASWFDAEQVRVHRAVNRIWPRRLGMTPSGLAAAINERSAVRYRWRLSRRLWGRADPLSDVIGTVRAGLPVAMLIGKCIPRHWVLFVPTEPGADMQESQLRCYEPTSGTVRVVDVSAVRRGEVAGLGYPRPFAFVLPGPGRTCTRCVDQPTKL
jgi:hypothetical protein